MGEKGKYENHERRRNDEVGNQEPSSGAMLERVMLWYTELKDHCQWRC